ncbi:hypothetical protein [Ancylobacter sp. FA202]|uniref:hypothetical protein n=1 Tax=Ancylobacter sp. FA202 TaxID=1111106 RepID=UPI0018DED43D|nr:hypothetical protein [Ancylobacter sp. FA202]
MNTIVSGGGAGRVDVVQHRRRDLAVGADDTVHEGEHVQLVGDVERGGHLLKQENVGRLSQRHRDPRQSSAVARRVPHGQ